MHPQTIALPALDVRAAVSAANEDERTIELTFSAGARVERFDWLRGERYVEVLSLDPAHVRLDRLNAGAPVLDSHSGWSVRNILGAVVDGTAAIAGKKDARATVRFSKRADVDPIWQDVRDKIIRFVSIGYRVYKFEEVRGKEGSLPVRTAVDWEPFEISMVPMPADAGAKVRSEQVETYPCVIETRAIEEERSMDPKETLETPTQAPAAPAAVAPEVLEAARQEERERAAGIQQICRTAKIESSFADDLVKRGVSLADARTAVLNRLAEKDAETETRSVGGVQFGEDARDKWIRGASNWLLTRAGVARLVAAYDGVKESEIHPGEFRGMTLLDLAKDFLGRNNIAFRGRDSMEVAGLAFRANYQTVSDFAVLLENTMHKVLRAAYGIQPDTWSRWCGVASVSDFRTHNWYRTGALSVLEDLNEHGEFKNKAIPDGEKATFSASTKGNIIAITRQTIVNDDLGSMMRLTENLGRAGKRTIEVAAYALLGQNSGLGPTQSDGQPLFHANRANVGVGAALSVDAIDGDRVVMASQKDPAGQEFLDLRPAILLVPVGLGGKAREINAQEYNDETSKNQRRPNTVRGLFSDVVDTPRLAGTRRYLFADTSSAPVFVVSFLDGQREPVLETKDGWRMDGVELKARLDFGVNAVDYRGAVTNAGA